MRWQSHRTGDRRTREFFVLLDWSDPETGVTYWLERVRVEETHYGRGYWHLDKVSPA